MPTKVHIIKAMVFPAVTYGCESWAIRKAERRRIDAFELWCWRRLLRVCWTARRSNPLILKEINPVSLFTLFTQPRQGTIREAERKLKEPRNCRRVYPLVRGAATGAAADRL